MNVVRNFLQTVIVDVVDALMVWGPTHHHVQATHHHV